MIANNIGGRDEVWAQLSAPVPAGTISWRQDGKPVARDGRHFARFVCYIEANTVRDRLDSVVPGEWDLTLELLPMAQGEDDAPCAFKARLQVLGVIREDVGVGKDYKQASTDAFKRAAVRFGIGHELYDYEQNWVEVDGDGKYAKPVEDPATAYERRHGNGAGQPTRAAVTTDDGKKDRVAEVDAVSCPKCGGRMWDNRLTKRNSKAPDYKCRDRNCDGVVWPARADGTSAEPEEATAQPTYMDAEDVPKQPRSTRRKLPPSTEDEIPF